MEIVAITIFVILSSVALYVSSQSTKMMVEHVKGKSVEGTLFSVFVTFVMWGNAALAIHYIIRICKEGIS